LLGRYQGRQLNPVDQSTADIFGGSIRPAPEKKGGKEVTISFAKVIAQENKRESITSAQKAGRRIKKAPAPKVTQAQAAKAKAKAKQGTKRRRTAEDEVIDRNVEPTEPVQGAKRQRRGRGPVPVPVPVSEPTQALGLRRRGLRQRG
jgi:hypothetical protein